MIDGRSMTAAIASNASGAATNQSALLDTCAAEEPPFAHCTPKQRMILNATIWFRPEQ